MATFPSNGRIAVWPAPSDEERQVISEALDAYLTAESTATGGSGAPRSRWRREGLLEAQGARSSLRFPGAGWGR